MSTLSRDEMINKLERKFPKLWCRTTEDFNGSKGGIWLCGVDEVVDSSGKEVFNYYTQDDHQESYVFGVRKPTNKWANKNGWYFEWNDAGTMMVWQS